APPPYPLSTDSGGLSSHTRDNPSPAPSLGGRRVPSDLHRDQERLDLHLGGLLGHIAIFAAGTWTGAVMGCKSSIPPRRRFRLPFLQHH
uniref:Uncharacterized protein n=1 Tax=Mustela putorius furo TaxID=9669 RepID=M3YE93_MUSPF